MDLTKMIPEVDKMDEDIETTIPPPARKVKIAVEMLPETRIERFLEDGKEEHEAVITPENRFMTFVRQLDFVEKSDKDKTEEDMKANAPTINPEDTKWAKYKKKVDQHIGRAHGEINMFVELLNLLKSENLTTIPCVKPPLSAKAEQDLILTQIAFKRAQLKKASSTFSSAARRLQENVEQYNRYLDQANQLRHNWKVGCPEKKIPDVYHPGFNVDYSYRNDGSNIRSLPPTMLFKEGHSSANPGDLKAQIPIDQLSRVLVIGNTTHSVSLPNIFDLDLKARDIKFNMATFSGLDDVHQMLSNAQESLFIWEAFDTLLKAAQKSKKRLYQCQDRELKFETADEQILQFKLVETKKVETKTKEQTEEEKLNVKHYVDTTPPDLRFLFRLVGIFLQQEIRNKHTQQMETHHRPKLARDFLREKPDHDETVLLNVIQFYEHMQRHNEVVAALNDLCQEVQHLSYRWVNTDSPFISSFDFSYDGQLVTCITVKRAQITLSTVENIQTVPQLIQSLNILLEQYIPGL